MNLSKFVTLVFGMSLVLAVPAFAKSKHDQHKKHEHKHQADCGHKSEKHGNHVDYEDGEHHHKQHGKHWDECKGPESEAPAADAKQE